MSNQPIAAVRFRDWSLRKQGPAKFFREGGLTLQKLDSQSPSKYSSYQEGKGLPHPCLWGSHSWVTLTRAGLSAEQQQFNARGLLPPWLPAMSWAEPHLRQEAKRAWKTRYLSPPPALPVLRRVEESRKGGADQKRCRRAQVGRPVVWLGGFRKLRKECGSTQRVDMQSKETDARSIWEVSARSWTWGRERTLQLTEPSERRQPSG